MNEDEEEVRGCTLTPTEAACTALGAGNKWLPGKPSCSASEYDDNVDPCLLPDLVARAKPLLGYEPEGAPISVGMMFASLSGDVWNEGDAAAHNVKAVFTVPPPMRVGTEFEFASGGTCTINKARTQITCTASKLEPDEGISVGAFVMIPEGASPVPQCNQEYILNVTGSTSDTEVTTENNSDQYRYFYSCGACCPHVDDPDRTCRYVSEEQCPTDNPFFTPTWLAPPFARCSLCPQRSSSSASSSAPTTGACCYVDSKPPSYSTTIERGVTESQCEIIKKGVYHPGNPPDSDISCPTAGDLKVTKSGPGVAEVKPGDTVSYTVTVENASDTDMTGTVGLVDSADPWLIVDETSMPEGCRKLQTLISCEMHGLSKGDSKSFTFTYTVSPTACPNRSSLSANSATVFAGAGNYDLNPLNNLAFSDTATLLCGDVGVCCTYEAGKPVAQCAGPSTAALCTGSDKTFVAGKQCSQPGVCPERPTGTCCGFSSLTQQLVSCQKNVTASGCAYGDFHEGENTGSCAEICTPPEYGTCCTLSGCEAKSTESRCSLIGGKWTKGENKCAECKPLGPCCKGPSAVQCEPATTEDECDADGGQWLGQGKYCSLCQYDVGVCCSATGEAMENVTQEMCGSMTGMDQPTVWLSGKDKNSCPKPGACCVVDPINDNCAQLTYDACKTRTGGVGNFRGEGVACPSSCKPSEPVGACCRPGLPCLENQTESQCLSMSPPGKWSGKATCATACPMGACCFMNSSGTEPQCASYDKQTCESVYKGTPMPGQACSACIKWFCYAGAYDPEGTKSCRSMMAAGDYLPAPDAVAYGTAGDCAAGCTPLAHCCDEDTNSCSPVMTGVSCKKGTTSADPQCGGSCAPAQKGACCESNGACSLTTEAACSGSFKGAETSCTTANICGAATVKAACCVGNACSEKTNAECTAAGGTSMGSPSCTLDLCADAPKGACCTATGCQSDKTQTECSAMAGTWNQGKTCDQVNQCKPAPGPGGCCAKDLIGEGVSCNYNLSETDCAQIPGQTWYPQNCSAQCNTMPVAACGPNCQPAVNGTCSLVAQEPSGWWASLLASLGFRTAQDFFEGTDLDFDGMIDCCCKPQGGTSSSAGGGTSSPPASSAQPEPKQCGACVGDSQTACENGQYACVWDGNALGFLQVLFGGSGGTCKPAPQCVGGSGGGTGNTGGTAGSSRPTQASSASSIVLALSAPSSAATVSSAIASVTPAPPASATSSSSSGPSFFSSSSSSRQKEAIIGLRIPQLCPPGLILKRDGSCGPIAVCPDPTNRGDIARYCRDVECRDSTNPAACLAGCTCGCVADRPAETTHRQEAAACVRACTTGTNTLCGANPTNECCQVACTGQHCPLPRQDDPLEI